MNNLHSYILLLAENGNFDGAKAPFSAKRSIVDKGVYMKKFGLFILGVTAFLSMTPCVYAVLPPLYQSQREIKAILENKKLGEQLSSGCGVQKIQRNKKGYEITTIRHRIQVDVIYQAKTPGHVGPAKFTLCFHEATPIPGETPTPKK